VKGTKTSKNEARESKNQCTWGESKIDRKMMADSDVGTMRGKTGVGWKESKEVQNVLCGERQSSTWGMDVAKWERERERSGGKYRMKTDWI
jgi:hypothetical protein